MTCTKYHPKANAPLPVLWDLEGQTALAAICCRPEDRRCIQDPTLSISSAIHSTLRTNIHPSAHSSRQRRASVQLHLDESLRPSFDTRTVRSFRASSKIST